MDCRFLLALLCAAGALAGCATTDPGRTSGEPTSDGDAAVAAALAEFLPRHRGGHRADGPAPEVWANVHADDVDGRAIAGRLGGRVAVRRLPVPPWAGGEEEPQEERRRPPPQADAEWRTPDGRPIVRYDVLFLERGRGRAVLWVGYSDGPGSFAFYLVTAVRTRAAAWRAERVERTGIT